MQNKVSVFNHIFAQDINHNNKINHHKKSIIILGLVVLSFTNAKAANEFKSQDLDQQESATLNVENTQEQNQLAFVNEENENETTVFSPDSVIKSTYVKTVEDIITENKSITEAQEEIAQPLSLETTLEDRIAEDNQITESNISKEFFPLDFEKINSKLQCVKVKNNNATITVDLKL